MQPNPATASASTAVARVRVVTRQISPLAVACQSKPLANGTRACATVVVMAQQGLDLAKYPVLVVDDESDNLDAFRFNFGRSFKLLLASSGEEALALARSEDVAAIVTDQRMPKMTGPGSAEGRPRGAPRRGRHHRHRVHRRRRADRGDQPRAHLSLRDQAVGLEGAARRAHARGRAILAGAREPAPRRAALVLRRHAVERRARQVQLRRHRR